MDADLVFRHAATGLYARVEVKDVSLDSQATNLRSLKIQIDKMAREMHRTGQSQFWINRRGVHPAVRQYASDREIVALGDVKTGRVSISGTISSKEAKDLVDQAMVQAGRSRMILAGTQLAYGSWMLIDAAPRAWDDFQSVWSVDSRTTQACLRLGEHGSYTLAGGSMVLSGGALLASRYAAEGLQAQCSR